MFIQSKYNQTCISMHQFDVGLHLIGWEDICKTEKQNIMKLSSVYSEHCFKLHFITLIYNTKTSRSYFDYQLCSQNKLW